MRKFGAISAGIALAGVMAASSASAGVTTFASFNATHNNNIVFANAGAGGSNSTYDASGVGGSLYTGVTAGGQPDAIAPSGVAVKFSFLQAALSSISNIDAIFTMNLSSTAAANPFAPVILQGGLSDTSPITASFTITNVNPFVFNSVNYAAGTNLLSGWLLNGVSVSGLSGSTSGSVNAATTAGATIQYTSAFMNFANTQNRDFALSLSAITSLVNDVNAGLNAPGGNLRSFTATATGSFSSEPAPGIPEPGTWAMMIAGFGLLGVSLRRRHAVAAV